MRLRRLTARGRALARSMAGPGPRLASQSAANAGFTLLEVLVVLVILGLIAAVSAGPQVFKLLGTAKSETAKMQIERIGGALDLYRLEVGRYPSDQESLAALVEPPAGVARWNGPYLKKKESIIDPWGQVYVYRMPGEHGEYDLYTLGADNVEGGEGESADVTSW